ncbi:hypothetical protein GCM10027288_33360 [Bordetella tumbae]
MRTLSRHELVWISGGFSEPRNGDYWRITMRMLPRPNAAMTPDGFQHRHDYDSNLSTEFMSFGPIIEDVENPFLRWTLKAAIVTFGIAFAVAVSATDDRDTWVVCS